jgi:hypothetical protein
MNIGPYPGDLKAKETLATFQSNASLEEIKAAIMGSILAVEMVQPSRVLKILHGEDDKGHPQFTSIDQAKEHMGILMGLWNKLTDHQSVKDPFRFSEIPNLAANDKDGWLNFSHLRESEITFFLRGLYAGNTPSGAELLTPTEEDLRAYLPFTLEVGLKALRRKREKIEQGTTELPAATLGAIALAIDDTYLSQYDAFLKQSLAWRKQHLDELRETDTFVRHEPKVGRNDQCPCGSGKKFKRCCFQ